MADDKSSRSSEHYLLMSNANDAHLIYKMAGTMLASSIENSSKGDAQSSVRTSMESGLPQRFKNSNATGSFQSANFGNLSNVTKDNN